MRSLNNDLLDVVQDIHDINKGVISNVLREAGKQAKKVPGAYRKLKGKIKGGKVDLTQAKRKGLSISGKAIHGAQKLSREYLNRLEATGMMPSFTRLRQAKREMGRKVSRHLTPRGKQALKWGTIGVAGEKVRRARAEGKKRKEFGKGTRRPLYIGPDDYVGTRLERGPML